jgi:hypothetical protein
MSTRKKSFRKRQQKTKRNMSSKQFYPMKGCSRIQKKGGWGSGDLAYPSNNVPQIRNPNLAYTGNGGNNSNLKYAYPNEGANGNWRGWLNSQNDFNGGGQKGGDCGCNNNFLQNGGANNGLPFGEGMAPMKGIPYAGGTSGAPLIPGNISSWPSVKPVGGNGNHYKLNTYNNDFTTNPRTENPLVSLKGGKRRKNVKKNSKKMKGGYSFSNSIAQDFVNIGRQVSNGVGNAFNAFRGYQQTSSPLPWKGQLANTPSYSALKMFKY